MSKENFLIKGELHASRLDAFVQHYSGFGSTAIQQWMCFISDSEFQGDYPFYNAKVYSMMSSFFFIFDCIFALQKKKPKLKAN